MFAKLHQQGESAERELFRAVAGRVEAEHDVGRFDKQATVEGEALARPRGGKRHSGLLERPLPHIQRVGAELGATGHEGPEPPEQGAAARIIGNVDGVEVPAARFRNPQHVLEHGGPEILGDMLKGGHREHTVEMVVGNLRVEEAHGLLHILDQGVLADPVVGVAPALPQVRFLRVATKVVYNPALGPVFLREIFRQQAVGPAHFHDAFTALEGPGDINPRAVMGLDAPLVVRVTREWFQW